MTVVIDNQAIKSISSLQASTQNVIALIQEGYEWLEQAIQDVGANYVFPDETNLAIGIQLGLHGRELMLIQQPDMLIHPAALLSLKEVQLEALTNLNTQSDTSIAQVEAEQGLSSHGFVGFESLAAVNQFLNDVDLDGDPLFQNMTLHNQLVLYHALRTQDTQQSLKPKLQKEAATFARDYAASVIEFSDYFQYYMSLLNRPAFLKSNKSRRASASKELLEKIVYCIPNNLQCPTAPGILTPTQLTQFVTQWISSGNQVGFARISRGVFQLAQSDEVVYADDKKASLVIESWIQRAQILITKQQAAEPLISQDGAALYYRIVHDSQYAILNLDTTHGFLTLHTFHPGQPQSEEKASKPSNS